tara:strand:- start:2 stop:682 length:681 start_codon:yes stop_codon:yes gene_type:complete
VIEICNLRKVFHISGLRKVVIENLNLTIPDRVSLALLGRNGAGKSTLLQILAGTMDPTSGYIRSTGTISWTVGFSGSFHPDLTGAQNTRFIARIYGVDTDALLAFVADFAQLGPSFHMPFRSYSSGMKSRLSFGVSMGIPFDTYLVDEVTSVGDAAFKKRSSELFLERMRTAGAIVVSHSMQQIRELCDVGIVLDQGRAIFYDDLEEAITHHLHNMAIDPKVGRRA